MGNGLQELVRRYSQGELSYGQYRHARAQIIDAIAGTAASNTASGITAPHVRAASVAPPRPTPVSIRNPPRLQVDTRSQTLMRPRQAPPVIVTAAPHEKAKAGGGRALWLSVIGVLALLGVIGAVLFFAHRTPASVPASGLAAVREGTSGQDILSAFLRARDWSAGGVAHFSQAWDVLDPAVRQSARHTPEFQRLADALYQRINEQRALDVAGGVTASQDTRVITAFARYLGIDYGALPAVPPAVSTAQPPVEKSVKQGAKGEGIVAGVSTASPHSKHATPPVPHDTGGAAPSAANLPATTKTTTTTETDATGAAGSAGRCRIALLGTRRPFCNDQAPAGVDAPLLVVIPGGEFQMGSSWKAEEQPTHKVSIPRAFAMSVHEISVAEFLRFCQTTHTTCPTARWPQDDYPVVDVSWRDAEAYAHWLTHVTGHRYRLPSEAEWEYAARAGSTTVYPGGDELLLTDARFSAQRQESAPLPISDHSINRNRFRLAHMLGNVREWVQDAWRQSYLGAPTDGTARTGGTDERVVRGGSYADQAIDLRSASRAHLPADSRDAVTGFRVVRELTE